MVSWIQFDCCVTTIMKLLAREGNFNYAALWHSVLYLLLFCSLALSQVFNCQLVGRDDRELNDARHWPRKDVVTASGVFGNLYPVTIGGVLALDADAGVVRGVEVVMQAGSERPVRTMKSVTGMRNDGILPAEMTSRLNAASNPAVAPDLSTEWPASPGDGVGLQNDSVPAFFIFGDSTVDCGNNNYLETLARADVPPYGRDFDTHMPTGRFSNGRISVDYLASLMGLPLVPAFLSQRGLSDMLKGSNLASAGAGILLSSGADLGQHISFVQQVQHITDIQAQMMIYLGEQRASDLISRSIYYISIGSNDYIHFYLRNVSGIRALYSAVEFNLMLTKTLSTQIKHLASGGLIKKIVAVGVGPLGCVPHYLWEGNSQNGECIEGINAMVKAYNSALYDMVNEINTQLPGVHILFCNIYDALYNIVQNSTSYGFESATTACCGAGRYGGWIMCLLPAMACQDSNVYVWWDEYHPTDRVNRFLAESLWSGMHQDICSPMNILELASLKISPFD